MNGSHVFRFSKVLALLVFISVGSESTAFSRVGDDWRELLRIINDENASFEERTAAEEALITFTDPEILRAAFTILAEPVGRWTPERPIPTAVHPGSEPWRQIVVARLQVFSHFARSAEPRAARQHAFNALFEQATTEFDLNQLVLNARQNWTSEVRERMLDLYLNGNLSPGLRRSAGWNLLDMHHATPRGEFLLNREVIIATAWQERGTRFAFYMSMRLGYRDDPRTAVLRLDLYENERTKARDREKLISKNVLDLVDAYFGNITGLYEERHGTVSDRALAIVREQNALRKEARATGDDTRLREFEAELAAKQQAELEERIRRIDAWIAANRDRLEQEAADYARQRQREQEPRREDHRAPAGD